MTLDSSAVVAVLSREQARQRIEAAMEGAGTLTIGAPTLFETTMVAMGRLGHDGRLYVEHFLADWGVRVTPFDDRHWRVALDAFDRYGKGSGHPARLNYGDCMTYASARLAGMPLLFVGDDFARTDIPVA